MIKGLELVVLSRNNSFEIEYENGKYYKAGTHIEVNNILDMICFNCGGAYYTLEEDPIEFCPHCGNFEKKLFKKYQELLEWSRTQNWNFLKFIEPLKPFAVYSKDRWILKFAKTKEELEIKGYSEVYEIPIF